MTEKRKVYLFKIPLDRQGYTRSGQYFGTGEKLYKAELHINDNYIQETQEFRAADRSNALDYAKNRFGIPVKRKR